MAEEPIVRRETNKETEGEVFSLKQSVQEGVLEVFPLETGEAREVAVEKKEVQGEGAYREILAKAITSSSASAPTDEDVIADAHNISVALLDEESKIQKVLDLAETKGVVHAVKVARTLDDYYALDQVHDALANKLYEGLLVRGLIQKD